MEVKCLGQRMMSYELTQFRTTTKVTSSRHSKRPNHMPTRDLRRLKLDGLTSSTEIYLQFLPLFTASSLGLFCASC